MTESETVKIVMLASVTPQQTEGTFDTNQKASDSAAGTLPVPLENRNSLN